MTRGGRIGVGLLGIFSILLLASGVWELLHDEDTCGSAVFRRSTNPVGNTCGPDWRTDYREGIAYVVAAAVVLLAAVAFVAWTTVRRRLDER